MDLYTIPPLDYLYYTTILKIKKGSKKLAELPIGNLGPI